MNDSPGWKIVPGSDARPIFPPQIVVQIKALACERPAQSNLPLSRFSVPDIVSAACQRGIVASISGSTIWRWLNEDAIKPWQHRSWIFPRDPLFLKKAAPVLDLYNGSWNGKPLKSNEFVISADEKTSIQARSRIHPTIPAKPGKPLRIEHEYKREGFLNYLAAWDVHRARIFGRCVARTGMEPFGRLVDDVMIKQPYCEAERVFWIVDNGSSHRGESCVLRWKKRWPKIVLVHLPVHASWLNQIEIFFSILQRKVLTPNDFSSLITLEQCIMQFQEYYSTIATPFEWNFDRADLEKLLEHIDSGLKSSSVAA